MLQSWEWCDGSCCAVVRRKGPPGHATSLDGRTCIAFGTPWFCVSLYFYPIPLPSCLASTGFELTMFTLSLCIFAYEMTWNFGLWTLCVCVCVIILQLYHTCMHKEVSTVLSQCPAVAISELSVMILTTKGPTRRKRIVYMHIYVHVKEASGCAAP